MFTKSKHVGGGNVRVDKYVEIIDWEAVGGAILIGLIILAILGQCAG